MFYRENNTSAVAHYYTDVKGLLAQHVTTSGPPTKILLRQPDWSQSFKFHPDCVLGDHEELFVTHPWNTPTFPRDTSVSIMTTSRSFGWRPNSGLDQETLELVEPDASYRTLTHHWFTPRLPSESEEPPVDGQMPLPPQIRRWMHHVPDTIEVGVDLNDLICPGSHGTHLLWIWGDPELLRAGAGMEVEFESKMHLATLLPPSGGDGDEADAPIQVPVRELKVDRDVIDLTSVAITDVEDAHGLIGLVMRPNADRRQIVIHLLYY